MLEELKKQVCEANRKLFASGLVIETFGNVSGVDRAGGHMVIKPSGVPYDALKPKDMIVVDLETGRAVEGELRGSSDTPTHAVLYRGFKNVTGVAHTHSLYATAWAQAGKDIPVLGTTHADYFDGPIPCTRAMTAEEIQGDYEGNTGRVILERFADLDPMRFPGALVVAHGAFAWGGSPDEAVRHAVVLEYLAQLAAQTVAIEPYPRPVGAALLRKHFFRKHGPRAYYGQE